MKEKQVWTLDGRKKIFLVDDCNHVIKEIKDLGPLSKIEMLWVMKRPNLPYKEWLIEYEKEKKGKKRGKKPVKKERSGRD